MPEDFVALRVALPLFDGVRRALLLAFAISAFILGGLVWFSVYASSLHGGVPGFFLVVVLVLMILPLTAIAYGVLVGTRLYPRTLEAHPLGLSLVKGTILTSKQVKLDFAWERAKLTRSPYRWRMAARLELISLSGDSRVERAWLGPSELAMLEPVFASFLPSAR